MDISPLLPSKVVTATDDAGVAVAVAVKDNRLGPFLDGADKAPPAATALLPSNELPCCHDDDEDDGAAARGWNLDVLLRGAGTCRWGEFSTAYSKVWYCRVR